jgi:hypothetical protein
VKYVLRKKGRTCVTVAVMLGAVAEYRLRGRSQGGYRKREIHSIFASEQNSRALGGGGRRKGERATVRNINVVIVAFFRLSP